MNSNSEFSTTLAPQNNVGWHLRPAGLLVKVASMFESEIIVRCGQRIASAKSLLGVLSLGAGNGARLYISARGRDAQMAIKSIGEKFSADMSTKEARMKDSLAEIKKIKPKKHVATTFKCGVKPDARKVYLVGDFNEWDPQADLMTKRNGCFSKSVKLTPGQYQYKFVIDGEWHADPAAPVAVSALGSINNVICV
jgi:phosphotransferase system HPr (HPr) family protein